MRPATTIADFPVYVVDDRCFVRLELLIDQMADTMGRAALMAYLWQRDLPEPVGSPVVES